ncbi:hypothetical protein A1O3_03837 [Capronia epimyces CBS 606.96]|uniref:DUF2470 domain-containing protein n=1 Tax=Capronia epimyces CBS 606.96 TaxID=1182542 RepID=W9Y327_9EURO|nr:uncharacterized protein A1O3_03837 [Capronia epimyces CBS 606.96]EXJ86883.1 hypothetical protein A1O3_03837 [Capronia epimyces CBS 606.96]
MSAAARTPPSPDAVKARIISHMNSDHGLSLRLYLAQYARIPLLSGTQGAQLVDITLDQMIISSAHGRHTVPLSPPMKSLLEARERLVAMHTECLDSLGVSDVVVDRYTPPDTAVGWLLPALCLLIFATFPFRDQLRPESRSVVARIWSLNGSAPALAHLCYTLQPAVLGFIVVVHAAEVVWFASTKLPRYWVEPASAVWWAWVLDCFVEGVGCLSRFDRIVGKAKETKSH